MDYIRFSIIKSVVTVIIAYTGLFYGQLGDNIAQILVFIGVNIGVLELAILQASLLVKAILIFVPQLVQEFSDSQVVGYSRWGAFVYSILRFIVDFLPEAKPTVTSQLLTGTSLAT